MALSTFAVEQQVQYTRQLQVQDAIEGGGVTGEVDPFVLFGSITSNAQSATTVPQFNSNLGTLLRVEISVLSAVDMSWAGSINSGDWGWGGFFVSGDYSDGVHGTVEFGSLLSGQVAQTGANWDTHDATMNHYDPKLTCSGDKNGVHLWEPTVTSSLSSWVGTGSIPITAKTYFSTRMYAEEGSAQVSLLLGVDIDLDVDVTVTYVYDDGL